MVTYTKDQIALACLSIGLGREQIKRILELLPDGETPSLPGQPDRLFYSVPEEKILGLLAEERSACSAICERLASMMEQGAGESEPGWRLRQAARLIRRDQHISELTEAEAALEKAGRQITGVVGPDGC